MSVVELNDLMTRISAIVGTDDESLALLDDVKDTFDSYTDSEDWKKKYEDLDNEWRTKYKERFTSGSQEREEEKEIEEEKDKTEKTSYDDLFETV